LDDAGNWRGRCSRAGWRKTWESGSFEIRNGAGGRSIVGDRELAGVMVDDEVLKQIN